ncbi:MAG: UvrD-helicase domain-containing protein [Actinomycetota bacterium]|nr:UvrD-helicase domain-containing protein [Actinomycetota bacterium]
MGVNASESALNEPAYPDAIKVQDTQEQLVTDLNPAQREAVVHRGAPLLVIAGAGSGKTRVLTRRIAHLVQVDGVPLWGILAITFTNKAAGEMKERLSSLLGPQQGRPWISTFHSACVRILRPNAERLGYSSGFTIYDDSDSRRLLDHVLTDLGIDTRMFPPRAVLSRIGHAKAEMLDERVVAERARQEAEQVFARIYGEYQRRLAGSNAMDFDDLLVKTVELFTGFPEILQHYQDTFANVLVDEYQDTNAVQNQLVMMLAERHRNICVVGDPDQSIYRFRGADVRNILEFERSFPDAAVIRLEQNYRSTQTILDAASSLIGQNRSRKDRGLWSELGRGSPIRICEAPDGAGEARWVVTEALRLVDDEHLDWSEMAVFYRTNSQSRLLEEEMSRRGVPYRMVGGTRFFDRAEVKDLIAYVRLLVNPADEVSLRRVINVPRRGVGDTSLGKLQSWAHLNGRTLADALADPAPAQVGGRAAKGIEAFHRLLEDLRGSCGDLLGEMGAASGEADRKPAVREGQAGGGAGRVLEVVLDATGYARDLEAEQTIEAEARLDNVKELVSMAAQYDDVASFIESASLASPADLAADNVASMSLMTLHVAKGLEFPVVFLVGMEEGLFPFVRSLENRSDMEEERRLCYVGMTRAKRHLHLSYARSRVQWGTQRYNDPSRFLAEVPKHLVEMETLLDPSEDRPAGFPRGSREDYMRLARPSPVARSAPITRAGNETGSHTGASVGTFATPRVRVGDDVIHDRWGEGVVVDVEGTDDDAVATVRFSEIGEKRMLLSIAPLRPALRGAGGTGTS